MLISINYSSKVIINLLDITNNLKRDIMKNMIPFKLKKIIEEDKTQTQSSLARQAGVSRFTVRDVIDGKNISLFKLEQIAKAVDKELFVDFMDKAA